MCDYSLHGIRNRLAEEGEILVVHRFFTGSKGLTSPEYLQPAERSRGFFAAIKRMFAPPPSECAVCIPDGARLSLVRMTSSFQQAHGFCSTESAIFRQLSAEAATYRDAVEFRNGVKLRIQELPEGQTVQVLTLSSQETEVRDQQRFVPFR